MKATDGALNATSQSISSNVDEAIETISSSFIFFLLLLLFCLSLILCFYFFFLFIFLNEKIFQAQNEYKQTKAKKAAFLCTQKHRSGRKPLNHLFAFCDFYVFCAFCACKILSLKKIKKFKYVSMASSTLLLNSPYY